MKYEKKEVTLGLLQIKHQGSPKKNLEVTCERIEKAASQGAQVICLQELFLGPYFCQKNDRHFFELAEEVPGNTTAVLSKLAKEKQVVIIASLFEKSPLTLPSPPRGEGVGEGYYNTACVLDADGKFLGKYRKIHIPDDPHNYYSEMFYFKPGDLGLKPFKTRYATIGVQVCWDQWFPEGARSLALQGAEILFYPTAIGWQVNGNPELGQAEHNAWITVQRGHAISNTVFVAATNRTGTEDHLNFWGSSFVSDPLGRILKQASADQEENLIVTCDLNKIQEVRKDWPFLSVEGVRPRTAPDAGGRVV